MTRIDDASQVEFGVLRVPLGNFSFLRFDALRMATYITSDNFSHALSSRTDGKRQIHRLNNCKDGS